MPSSPKSPKLTPAMKQYQAAKAECPDSLLLFRMGDFYEVFFDDAKTVSRALGLVLTSRSKGADAVPMAGFPVHSLDLYVKRLVRAGHRIAVCEQLENPAEAKGLVKRGVTRVITPGTLTEDNLLEGRRNNFLLSIFPDRKQGIGLAWVDLSVGRLWLDEVVPERLVDAITRIDPSELLVPDRHASPEGALRRELDGVFSGAVTSRPDWSYSRDNARSCLCEFYGASDLGGFGLAEAGPCLSAAGALVEYLKDTQKQALPHIGHPRRVGSSDAVELDRATIASLELTETMRTGEKAHSLVNILDKTVTSMGGRLMRQWVLAPLKRLEAVQRRQDAVAEMVDRGGPRHRLRDILDGIFDIERVASRLACERADGRDVVSLGRSLAELPELKAVLSEFACAELTELVEGFDTMQDVRGAIEQRLQPDPPTTLTDGGLIREGFCEELDRLRHIRRNGRQWLAEFQARESARTGIANLKVGFNKVFGYYIEVRSTQTDKVPEDYQRKQTLKGAERYITPELKEHETEVTGADERAKALEYQLFCELRLMLLEHLKRIQQLAEALARLDALAGLAQVAVENGYVRPALADDGRIDIVEGRHPVLERTLVGETFVPNDCTLDGAGNLLTIITGPNMAGKSTYIRQVALVVLMAQMGSFIPARKAHVGLVDAIFTRVGASDELARGRSTFMVEMTETAYILNTATERSLVIFDEVGRGTGTFDGLSIAWAVCEYVVKKIRCRTLFATHYHQLTGLAELYDGVVNRNIAVREWQDKIVFLHKIVDGGTDKSYGIHVARLAGVPRPVIDRSRAILSSLEEEALELEEKLTAYGGAADHGQLMLNLFGSASKKVVQPLKGMDLDKLTGDEALELLKKLKEAAQS